MTEEDGATAAAQSCDYDYGYASALKMRFVVGNDSGASAQAADDDDDDYPIPYSEEKAQQWAKEDPDFHIETYRQDPCFDKEAQAELRRAMASVKAGNTVTQTYVNGEWVFAGE